jgi:hypothetical protein
MIDITTNRVIHFHMYVSRYIHRLGNLPSGTYWWDNGDGYATTNVIAAWPVVTHFRIPLSGGDLEVSDVAGEWHRTGWQVTEPAFTGYATLEDFDVATYRVPSFIPPEHDS